jgi:Prophage CP4-57 regulatory protein (AlpA)
MRAASAAADSLAISNGENRGPDRGHDRRGGTFPIPRSLGPNTVRWLQSEVDAWIRSLPSSRAGAPASRWAAAVINMLPPKAHAQPSCGIGTGRHTALDGNGRAEDHLPKGHRAAQNRGEPGTCTQRCALRLAADCIIALIQLLRKWSHHAEPHLVTCRPGKRVIPLGGRATCTTSLPRSPVGAVPYGSRRGPLGKGGIKKISSLVSGSDPQFSETHRGTRPYFFGTVGLGNRKGTNAMIRSDRFIAGIAIVSIIASLGYIALTLIG